MLPSSFWGVVFFVVLVAPGLVLDHLRHRHHARVGESPFRELARVVLTSLVCSGVAFVALAALDEVLPDSVVAGPRAAVGLDAEFARSNFWQLLVGLVLFVSISTGLAVGWYWRSRPADPPLIPKPAWEKVFRSDNPTEQAPVLRIRLQSGTIVLGTLAEYTKAYELDDRELVLAAPLWIGNDDESLQAVDVAWQRLVVAGTDIETILVQYPLA
ncbi:hypothetical protein FB554_2399 [Barrientosiimonas humi]|uniref:Uncharacterized protein n=1 Tax=Barrientosiimonas humi TaxID=999931 RepID=A0A542XEM1_9MICO|nr:DUF6338 family protein [Barrientosiimonas humi]TQL34236.1 hypothetical protein FB554_2399 [Barrientosiimonas humi]CAG7574228.1 hypothetical protein BH39T_PBIAJDOK_02871 [Barrientosiimonas humi]